MKLSTIWTDFDEFLDFCLKTDTNDTRHKMKIYSTHFDENGFYQFDWNKLFVQFSNLKSDNIEIEINLM